MGVIRVASAAVNGALTERAEQFAALAARAEAARAGTGGLVLVTGESGAGKTSFVEAFTDGWPGPLLWGACDPLSTPRPLGPIHDLAGRFAPHTRALLSDGGQPLDIFAAVADELARQPTLLVLDDLHWADQATIDLLRFVLRRAAQTSSLTVGIVRDDEVGVNHPLRALLGDIARSAHATSLPVPALSLRAVTALVGQRSVDPAWLHRVSGGNAFFVCEMLDHDDGQLPTTVRDAILARTVGLDVAAWDLLYLLTCAPGAIPDHLLAGLGVTVPALRTLDDANLIRRTARGVAFRHDLCRLAVAGVIPPGAEPVLHRRLIAAHDAAGDDDQAVITHHARGAGDRGRLHTAAAQAGAMAARTGAHTQAAEFFRIALDSAAGLDFETEAGLLESMANEYYLTDRLDEAIDAARRAMLLREQAGAAGALSANCSALAVYEWYNANRVVADEHADRSVRVLDGCYETVSEAIQLGHAVALQAFLAIQAGDLDHAASLLRRAHDLASDTADPALTARVGLVDGLRGMLSGAGAGRADMLAILRSGPAHIDEIYSSGYSNLSYLDVEQRRLNDAADFLDVSIPLMGDHDLPVCRVWQLGSRARLQLLAGDWDGAAADAASVLDNPCAPLARTWPLLVRALIGMRRDGSGAEVIDAAWELAHRYGEPLRTLPAASAVAERAWLTGTDDPRLDACRAMLTGAPVLGLEWARGELAMWLHRLGFEVPGTGLAEPYRLVVTGDPAAAAVAFSGLATPYDEALALIDSRQHPRRGLDILDRLGADEVAAKVRRDLRADGVSVVPARRRATTLENPAGLTNRQIEVLQLLDGGLTNTELAERLYLSAKTVDHHVSAILSKLQVTRRRDAVARARELGIVK